MNRYNEDVRFLPALQGEIVDDQNHALSQAEAAALAGGQQFAGLAMAGRSGLSRAQQTDTAITHAQAHLLAAAPTVAALAMVTSGLVLLGFLVAGRWRCGSGSSWRSWGPRPLPRSAGSGGPAWNSRRQGSSVVT